MNNFALNLVLSSLLGFLNFYIEYPRNAINFVKPISFSGLDTTISPIMPIESIEFDINGDNRLDTITLYQYRTIKYKDSEFQSIEIKLANSSKFYGNLSEPYDFIDSNLISKYSLINSKRLIITKVDSNYYVVISSISREDRLGYLTIFNAYMDNINISLNERLFLDSIAPVNDKYYKNALFAKAQQDSSYKLKNVIYVISDAKYDDPIQLDQRLTDIYFKKDK